MQPGYYWLFSTMGAGATLGKLAMDISTGQLQWWLFGQGVPMDLMTLSSMFFIGPFISPLIGTV